MWRRVFVAWFPWGVTVSRINVADVTVRLWPHPWASVRWQYRVCLVAATSHGYVADTKLRRVLYLWGRRP